MGKELVRGEMIEILEMTAAHTAQVAELEKCCFSDPWSEKSIAGELNNPLSLWLVAMEREKVVGYVGSQSVLPESDMMNLAVDPAYRRQGVGQLLVTELLERLRSRGCSSLTLEVRASNGSAQALYEKLGFALAGRRPRYYQNPREDALILRKEWDI